MRPSLYRHRARFNHHVAVIDRSLLYKPPLTMEAAATSSSSKVIIQCTDPSNVLELFRERLEPRTPLKNLHWKSPSRPLRSIPSLDISLARNEPVQNGAQSNTRRHQIPGLRETPYVKLYLLRCDDKETYKETARKEIKQWIRENTFEKESKSVLKKQEHHDAFEWMIVHVVLPGTQASSQPQSSKHISLNDTESTDSVNSKSKWTGKSTSTIHDKLRADFSSSKLPVPRVAQVRILDPAKPPGALGPSDVEEQWRDFVDNLKASILKSFDTRVAQYEEDIREREAQRSLPGWNFCTFFVLKEALARGFESVGLLEDALAVYSELEVGLDAVVQQSHNRDEADLSGALLPYSKDLKASIRKALDEEVADTDDDLSSLRLAQLLVQDHDNPFDVEKRKYRELILANDVSPLDVRTYIFTRQMDILLRRARVIASGAKHATDLEIMAELAELALNFINLGSRELRLDMQAAWGGRLSGEERATQKVVIGNVVASWTWAATVQILNHMLPHTDLEIGQFDASNDVLEEEHQLAKNATTHDTLRPASSHSSRAASPHPGLRVESLSSTANLPKQVDGQKPIASGLRRPGMDHLCSTVAKLFLLLRKTIENLPAVMGWVEEIRTITAPVVDSGKKVPLHRLSSGFNLSAMNGEPSDTHLPDAVVHYRLQALVARCLQHATSSRQSFHQVYRLLSKAMHHLLVKANSKHSARQVLIDLAMLAFTQEDYSFARRCISTILEAKADEPVVGSQPHVLSMYADCLRRENRPDDLALCLIELLQSHSVQESPKLAQRYYDELFEVAKTTSPLTVPMDSLVHVVGFDRTTNHKVSKGGFAINLALRSRVAARLKLESIHLTLKAIGHSEPQEIVLKRAGNVDLGKVTDIVELHTPVSTNGWYNVDELEVRLGNLRLHRSFADSAKPVADYKPMLTTSDPQPLLVYPGPASPQLILSQSGLVDLEKTKILQLTLQTSNNDLDECALHIRPGTAGLRLNLLDSKLVPAHAETEMKVEHSPQGTALKLGRIGRSYGHVIEIPYTLENQAEPHVNLKCILDYSQDGERYSLHQTCSAEVFLPLSVSVQDIYRAGLRYSTFLMASVTRSPLEILDCHLNESEHVTIQTADMKDLNCTVFYQQPARWPVILKQREESTTSVPKLKLTIRYRKINEAALASLEKAFMSEAHEAGLGTAARILSRHLITTIRSKWREHDLEVMGLTHEVEKWSKSELDWQQVMPAFESSLRQKIDQWLSDWHANGDPIAIDLTLSPSRELRLGVDMRPSPPVITAALQIHLPTGQATASVGQPLMCSLTISTLALPVKEAVHLTYELLSQSDAWIMGGRKKGVIHCDAHDVEEQQSIVLFPQRTGTLLLPSIEIRCRKKVIDGDARAGMEGDELPIDVHNKSISMSVQVTPGLHSSTIGLPVGGLVPTGQVNTAATGILLQSNLR